MKLVGLKIIIFTFCMSIPVNYGKVMVVVPAFNEQGSVATVILSLLQKQMEVILVDDGSEIDLRKEVSGLPIHFLRHGLNLGQGAALQTGIEYALDKGADYIITFDADGQHDPDDIEILLQALKTHNADISLGSRFLEGAGHKIGRAHV